MIQGLINHHGKIYIGTSAGSIIAGPKLPDYLLDLGEEIIDDELPGATGFGFVNFIIIPHWRSEGFKNLCLKSRLSKIFQKDQHPLLK